MIKSRTSKDADLPRRRLTVDDETPTVLEGGSQFRRNQTLSSHRVRFDEETSHRHRLHHLSHRRRRVGGIFLLVMGIIVILALLVTQFTARVQLSTTNEDISRPLNGEAYAQRINEYYGVHPVERLRFILNDDALTQFVAEAYPEVADVRLAGSEDIVDTRFTLTFRQPIAGWQINNKQYYVDNQGVVFETNYFDSPKVQIVDESGFTPEQGSAVASARLLSFVGKLVSGAGERGLNVTSVSLPSGMTRQLEVRVASVQSVIRVTIDRAAGEQVEDMARVIRYLKSEGTSARYVDVRVPGRAVYR